MTPRVIAIVLCTMEYHSVAPPASQKGFFSLDSCVSTSIFCLFPFFMVIIIDLLSPSSIYHCPSCFARKTGHPTSSHLQLERIVAFSLPLRNSGIYCSIFYSVVILAQFVVNFCCLCWIVNSLILSIWSSFLPSQMHCI